MAVTEQFANWLKSYVGKQDASTMRFSFAELEIAFDAGRIFEQDATPQVRTMLVGDLYHTSPHLWPVDQFGSWTLDTECKRCRVHRGSIYDDENGCPGPWWMRCA